MAVINISHFIVSHSWEASSFTRQRVLNTKWLSTAPVDGEFLRSYGSYAMRKMVS